LKSFHLLNLVVFLVLGCGIKARSESLILHLKNGDRVAGEVVSESTNQITLKTPWADALGVSKEHIDRIEKPPVVAETKSPEVAPVKVEPAKTEPAKTNTPPAKTVASQPPPAKKPSELKFEVKFGTDMIRGQRDRDTYYGQFAMTYAHPYEANSKKFFRNRLDYRADYGTTDGRETSNRMSGGNKTDFDFLEHGYFYNYVGGGFDQVRRINAQYEAGPGVGYHLLRHPKFITNIEGGLTYQYQDRDTDDELESLYGRVGQDVTWKIMPKVVFTQRSSLLTSLEDAEELQFRLEANLSLGLVQNLSLNFTAIELYDTRPVPGISRNEFQFRSALGITF